MEILHDKPGMSELCDSSFGTDTFRNGLLGAAGCNKEVALWFFKEILVGNKNEGTKSWEGCMKEGQE